MSVPLVLFAVLSAVIVAGGVTITVTALVVFIQQRARTLVPLFPTGSETLRCSQTDGVICSVTAFKSSPRTISSPE